MRIVAVIHTYFSEAYIGQVLDSLMKYVERIIIIDGSYNPKLEPLHSDDRTEQIVKRKKMIEPSIVFIKEHSKDEVTQRNKVFRYLNSRDFDWMLIVDDDEVYHADALFKLRNFLETAKEDGYFIYSIDFVNSFSWYRKNYHRRVFRVKGDMKFYGINRVQYGQEKYVVRNFAPVVKYHYSHICNLKKARIKLAEINHKNPWRYADGKFMRDDLKVFPFDGVHPLTMQNHPYRRLEWTPPKDCL